jgi:hypothetical protein
LYPNIGKANEALTLSHHLDAAHKFERLRAVTIGLKMSSFIIGGREMTDSLLRSMVCCGAIVVLMSEVSRAEEPKAADGLIEFSSKAGRFSVRLPQKPKHKTTTVGNVKEIQHQFSAPGDQGVYLVSYQDNPNLEGSGPAQLQSALESGRDKLQQVFRGELLESKAVKLDKLHPGLGFRVSLPQANGEARCRFYMVGTRLYQILVIGVPEFTASQQATQVIDSFKLLP